MMGQYGFDADLRRGDEGAQVTEWQRFLTRQGFNIGQYGDDGDFGAATQAATRAFQAREDVPQTGELDAATFAAAQRLGFGMMPEPPLSAAEAAINQGSGLVPASSASSSSDMAPVVADPGSVERGPLGRLADDLFTPRGLAIAAGVTMIGTAAVMLARGR